MFANSFRWKTAVDLDVDAFALAEGDWLLFAYVKDESKARDPERLKSLALEFRHGQVRAVAGAFKTEKQSEPLAPVMISGHELPREVWCREGWLRYRLETAEVLNPGLFLDQADNRQRLIELVQHYIQRSKGAFGENDGVLNLFSFTGSFSVAAVCAGAKSTTSVDVSSRYLSWEKQNFEGNFGGFDQIAHRHFADDARDFLRRAVKRGSKYRWIIIDPPTFSRGQGKLFKVQDEMLPMLEEAVACLTPGGAILASCNDARWEPRQFSATIEKFAKSKRLVHEPGRTAVGFGPQHPLKSAWLFSTG